MSLDFSVWKNECPSMRMVLTILSEVEMESRTLWFSTCDRPSSDTKKLSERLLMAKSIFQSSGITNGRTFKLWVATGERMRLRSSGVNMGPPTLSE